MASDRKGGFGLRTKDGRRFGYEVSARNIEKEDLVRSLGEKRFSELLKDHAEFSPKEWEALRHSLSRWTQTRDGVILRLFFPAIAYLFATASLLTFQTTLFFLIFVPLTSVLAPLFYLAFLNNTLKWFFYNGNVSRMMEVDRSVPDWVVFKGDRMEIRK